jgi:tetratricopeptide (TPR) repeat protein
MTWFLGDRRKRADKYMAQGRVEKAIALYVKERAWDALVGAYQGQGNYAAAADAAERGGFYAEAADLFERAGDPRGAARVWLKMGQKEQAARAYEMAQAYDQAVELYAAIGRPAKGADVLAGKGRWKEAAALYEKAGERAKAAHAWREAGSPGEAARVLADGGDLTGAAGVLCDMGDKTGAAELLRKAGRFPESAALFEECGRFADAGAVLEAGGNPVEAAERYLKDPATMTKAAALLATSLAAQPAWRRQLPAHVVAMDVTPSGALTAAAGQDGYVMLLDDGGGQLWRWRVGAGIRVSCVALSSEGLCVLGSDDRRVRLLGKDRAPLCAVELPEEPMAVDIDSAGERVIAAGKGRSLFCLNARGDVLWRKLMPGIICDATLSQNGRRIAVGMADGTCLFFDAEGDPAGECRALPWVDGVALSDDGARCAMVVGTNSIALFDATVGRLLWSATESSAVHSVALAATGAALCVSDDSLTLRDPSGAVLFRGRVEGRLMGGRISANQRFILSWNDAREVARLDLKDCRHRAAEIFEQAGDPAQAAAIFEDLGENARAAKAFKAAGDLRRAARNTEVAGASKEAAAIYESLGDFEKAAPIFEAEGEFVRAAECFSRIGQVMRAAKLFEQANEIASAAALFEKSGQCDKAAGLYKAAGDVPSAIRAYEAHLAAHPEAVDLHLELGLLLQSQGAHDRAIESLQQATRSKELARTALMRLAESFIAKGLYDIALGRYRACLDEKTEVAWDNLDVHYGMAKTLQLAGNYAEARRLYEAILAIHYNYADVQKRLADVQALGSVFAAQPKSAAQLSAEARTVVVNAPGAAAPDNLYQNLSAETKDRYVVRKHLGRGGMGTVYLAEDTRLKRMVALKVLAPHLAADERVKVRMVREAQAAAQIDHPNCVRVYDVVQDADGCFMTMEYVTGRTLRKLIAEKGRMAARESVEVLLQMTEGLGHAHGKGITHRDMKPDNVIITDDGVVKVMDFGLALVAGVTRLTMEGGTCGTVPYMAPEQLRGETGLTPAADVYAVGCIIYEMLSGKMPFEGADSAISRLMMTPPPLAQVCPDAPKELVEIVEKCMAADAAGRYVDGRALNKALKGVRV